MAKIVTGGNGLVGSQFGSQYQKLGRNDADLTQKDETISVFKALAPDVVIHAAAEVGGLYSKHQQQRYKSQPGGRGKEVSCLPFNMHIS
jgi:dTDP-4-dehydrorhamnose reductase